MLALKSATVAVTPSRQFTLKLPLSFDESMMAICKV
jgi:hypothetical protein